MLWPSGIRRRARDPMFVSSEPRSDISVEVTSQCYFGSVEVQGISTEATGASVRVKSQPSRMDMPQ